MLMICIFVFKYRVVKSLNNTHPVCLFIVNPIVNDFTEDEWLYGYFHQYYATAPTVLVTLWREHDLICGKGTINRGSSISCSSRPPDFSFCDFYLWGKLLGRVYTNNPHTLEKIQKNTENPIVATCPAELLFWISHSEHSSAWMSKVDVWSIFSYWLLRSIL